MSRGRPSKLTAEIQAKICEQLERGLFRRHAAGLAGVDEQLVSRWYSRGANETRGIYAEFYAAVNMAEAKFAQSANEMILANGAQNPKSPQWMLSRRFAELYGRRDNVEQVDPADKAAEQAQLRETLMDRLAKFLPEEQTPVEPAAPAAEPPAAPADPPAPEPSDAVA